MVDSRYDKISELFVNYSNGNFDYKIEISDKLDEIDAFISSINMLGEELKEITISKEFFNNVFDSVSDLIFVLDMNGLVTKINKAVVSMLKIEEEELVGNSIDLLFNNNSKSFFKDAVNRNHADGPAKEFTSTFYFSEKNHPSLCTFNRLYSELGIQIGYTLIIKDLTNLKRAEDLISKTEEKYRRLFEESGDSILLISSDGSIVEINSAGRRLFNLKRKRAGSIYTFITRKDELKLVRDAINSGAVLTNINVTIGAQNSKKESNCLLTMNKLSATSQFQVILKDITLESEVEKLMFRTIVNTQENERRRFAQDIHDVLGQQLSAIKFYLSTLRSTRQLNEKSQELLEKSENGLNSILTNLREICFNLMPKTIENFGLVAAVNELAKNVEIDGSLKFDIFAEDDFPRLNSDKEIAVFRIIQEFINNSLKHAHATSIKIAFRHSKHEIHVRISDNGIGFDTLEKIQSGGLGLKNVITRARSHNGHISIESDKNSGTKFELVMPKNEIKINHLN